MHRPLPLALRPLLCLGVATLALLAAPAWAATGTAAPMPAAGEADADAAPPALPPTLPYGAGYEQRLRAARSTAQGSPSLPASAADRPEPVRNSGFGRSGAGRGGQGGGNGNGNGGGGGGRGR